MDTLEKFYQEKYGKEVCADLLKDHQLLAENIKCFSTERQQVVKQQVELLKETLKLSLDVDATKWAFDFPGWLGKLDTTDKHLKKYMIIGLEPHIKRYDYQITYGLSDRTPDETPDGKQRFSLNKEKEIVCQDDSKIIWPNLYKIMASEKQLKEAFVDGNEQTIFDFLNQFYIMDLCHFAPQDKAKAVRDIKDWTKIRYKVASHFLLKEIELIKPEVIITQGNGVFTVLRKILRFEETKSYPLLFGKNKWSIKTGKVKKDQNNQYDILSIPHFGSDLNNKTFYMNNLDLVRNTLLEHKLI
jgi:hypothetical protein